MTDTPTLSATVNYTRVADQHRAEHLGTAFRLRGYDVKVNYTAHEVMQYPITVSLQTGVGAYTVMSYDYAQAYLKRLENSVALEVVRLENLGDLPLPAYETDGAAGMDLRAAFGPGVAAYVLPKGEIGIIPTGISIAVPEGYEVQIRPRSGLAAKYGLTVLNTPGTIDSDYRGEIKVIMINHGPEDFVIQRGERVAQMVLTPVSQARFVEVKTLKPTTRGEGHFGSTGK